MGELIWYAPWRRRGGRVGDEPRNGLGVGGLQVGRGHVGDEVETGDAARPAVVDPYDGIAHRTLTLTASQPALTASTSGLVVPYRARAIVAVSDANRANVAVGLSRGSMSVSYQIWPGGLPRVAAEGGGDDVEGVVGDARVGVDAAAVAGVCT